MTEINEKRPHHETLLAHLVKYGSLTGDVAFTLYRIRKIQAVVWSLEQKGFKFIRTPVTPETPTRGRKLISYSFAEADRLQISEVMEYARLKEKFGE